MGVTEPRHPDQRSGDEIEDRAFGPERESGTDATDGGSFTATQLAGYDRVAMLVEESRELLAILTSIARNTDRNR